MVLSACLCLIVGSSRKSGRDKGIYFARVPSIVTNQGEKAQELSEERWSRWISAISRDDLTEEILEHDRVCSSFHEERLQVGINLILTGFHHYIWNTGKFRLWTRNLIFVKLHTGKIQSLVRAVLKLKNYILYEEA